MFVISSVEPQTFSQFAVCLASFWVYVYIVLSSSSFGDQFLHEMFSIALSRWHYDIFIRTFTGNQYLLLLGFGFGRFYLRIGVALADRLGESCQFLRKYLKGTKGHSFSVLFFLMYLHTYQYSGSFHIYDLFIFYIYKHIVIFGELIIQNLSDH